MYAAYCVPAYEYFKTNELPLVKPGSLSGFGWPYDDLDEIPEWAYASLLFCAYYRMLDQGIIEQNVVHMNPYGSVTKDELEYGLTRVDAAAFEALGFLPDLALDILNEQNPLLWLKGYDYSNTVATNTVTGSIIYLGMPATTFGEMMDVQTKPDWTYLFDGLSVFILCDRVASITIGGEQPSQWEIRGINVGCSEENVEQILGTPSVFIPKASVSQQMLPFYDTAVYCFDLEGMPVDNNDDAVSYLEISYAENGEVYKAFTAAFPSIKDEMPVNAPSLGFVFFSAKGSGDVTVYDRPLQQVFIDINYSGYGSFKIVNGDEILFSVSGSYVGTIFLVFESLVSLSIQADGDWEIEGYNSLQPRRLAASGNGDFAFPVAFLYGRYKVMCSEPDAIEIRFVPYAGSPSQEHVIIESETGVSEIIEFDGVSTMYGCIVISTNGDWVFERVFEYTVVDSIQEH